MPNHVMSCFEYPHKLTTALDRECRKFFWGSNIKFFPVAWKHVCQPKSMGNLGVRPANVFNNSALSKLGWKLIIEPNNWWAQIVRKKKYL
jgi:hypothetical protein